MARGGGDTACFPGKTGGRALWRVNSQRSGELPQGGFISPVSGQIKWDGAANGGEIQNKRTRKSVSFYFGAPEGTRTHTLAHENLNLSCLPIPSQARADCCILSSGEGKVNHGGGLPWAGKRKKPPADVCPQGADGRVGWGLRFCAVFGNLPGSSDTERGRHPQSGGHCYIPPALQFRKFSGRYPARDAAPAPYARG